MTKAEKRVPAEEQLISQAKAAEMCGMTREAIRLLVRAGRFRSVEVEGRDMVFLDEVVAFERAERRV